MKRRVHIWFSLSLFRLLLSISLSFLPTFLSILSFLSWTLLLYPSINVMTARVQSRVTFSSHFVCNHFHSLSEHLSNDVSISTFLAHICLISW